MLYFNNKKNIKMNNKYQFITHIITQYKINQVVPSKFIS